MRHRSVIYFTVLCALLFPLLGALWARSYLHDEALYRIGRGYAIMLSCIRGEVALWAGPTRDAGPVRYAHESNDTGYSMTAAELLAHDRSAQQYWLLGFGYGQTYGFAPRDRGPVRCVVVPMWFLTLLALAFPGRVLMRHMRRNRAAADAELACCRRCGAQLAPAETRCQACRFPAFIRRGVVA